MVCCMGALCTDAWMHGPEAVWVEIGLGTVGGGGGNEGSLLEGGKGRG